MLAIRTVHIGSRSRAIAFLQRLRRRHLDRAQLVDWVLGRSPLRVQPVSLAMATRPRGIVRVVRVVVIERWSPTAGARDAELPRGAVLPRTGPKWK